MSGSSWCTNCLKRVPTDQNDIGLIYCTDCGKVVDQDIYSNEPTFTKNAAGQSQMSGNYVKTVQSEYSASRERTLSNARYYILNFADNLGVEGGDQVAGPAIALYTIALERNFTRGRRADQVAAACLYISCREKNKPFLLIEFAELLGVNVYVLGAVFLQLCKLLSLQEHPIVQKPVDPSLFIHRFTNVLLGRKNHGVEKTALRIMASMKRNWMQTGRKPSGLCGAALYISALAHGHKFTKTDIVRIVHVCEATLTKRLIEFEDTASGSLTIEELNQNAEELERNLKSSKEASSCDISGKIELLCEHKGKDRPHFAHGLCESCHEEFLSISGGLGGEAEPPAFQRAERARMILAQAHGNATDSSAATGQLQSSCITAEVDKERRGMDTNTIKRLESVDSGGVSKKDTATSPGHDKGEGADNASTENGDGSENLSDIDDAEVDGYLHNEEEKEYKRVIWEEMNWEYLKEQAIKEAAAEAVRKAEMEKFRNCSEDERAARELALDVAAQLAKSKKEQRIKRAAEMKTPQTAAEATHQMLTRKKFSSRVNYDALKEIFDEPVASNNAKKMKTDSEPKESNMSPILEDDIETPGNKDRQGTPIDEDYYGKSNEPDYDCYNQEEVYNNDDDPFF